MSSNNSRQIIVDDNDDEILYSPGWFLDSGSQDAIGNYGPTYQHTLHGIKANGSLSFTFQGTQVTVLGTSRNVLGGRNNTIWECFVDNVSIGGTQYFDLPRNNAKLCNVGGLKDGNHELTVNVITTGQTFWVDYIGYIPSPSLSLGSTVFLVDNTDTAITYDMRWNISGVFSMTQTFESTMSFNFTGTGVSWMGLFPQGLPRISTQGKYSIDGGSQHPFGLNGLPVDKNATQYNQLFFSATDLPAGPHNLRVMYQGNSQLTPLTLDYLYVTNTPSPSSSTGIHADSKTGTNTNPSSAVSLSSPGTHVHPVGAIAGGAIGGVVFIVLTLALFFWYRRRHGHARRNEAESPLTPYSYDESSHSAISTSHKGGTVIRPLEPIRLPSHKSSIVRGDAPPGYTPDS